MFLVGSIPICDARPFVNGETGRLLTPAWPDPRPGTDFVRSFGHITGTPPRVVCDATWAMRFPDNFAAVPLGTSPSLKGFGNLSRTYRSDGRAVGRFDVAVYREPAALTSEQLLSVSAGLLDCAVKVPQPPGDRWRGIFINSGRTLAKLLLARTTSSRQNGAVRQDWWVGDGSAMVIGVWEPTVKSFPGVRVTLSGLKGLTVNHTLVKHGKRMIPFWFLGLKRGTLDETLSRAFEHFSVVHSQRECLREVLRLVLEERVVAEKQKSQSLQDFLKSALSWTSVRPQRFGVKRSATLDAIYAADRIVNAEEFEQLSFRLRQIRPNLRRQVDEGVSVNARTARLLKQLVESSNGKLEVSVGDKYVISGQAGAVGPGAMAVANTFTQAWNTQPNQPDMDKLAEELQKVREQLKKLDASAENDIAVGQVAEAEKAAKNKDGPAVLHFLGRAGNVALDTAIQIDVPLATAVLQTAMRAAGLPV